MTKIRDFQDIDRFISAFLPIVLVYPYKYLINSQKVGDEVTHLQALFPFAHCTKIKCVFLMVEGVAEFREGI